MGRVVVGIDGSEGAREALAFAAEEARLRGASLEVVYVHALGSLGSPFAHGLSAEVVSGDLYAQMVAREQEERDEFEERARQFGERLLSDAVEATDTEGLTVETTLLFDRRPAKRLVSLTNERGDVDLLVVGSRGRGELTGRLLGSVSQAVVNHARVPVSVIRSD
jgi:nucleotide-binding universal stress UspA family protein